MHIECTVFTTLSKIIQYNPKQHVPLRMGFIFSGYYTELCCDKTIRLVTLAQPLAIRRLYYTRTRTTNILLIKFYTDLIETLKISERTHSFWFFFMSFLQLQWLWHEAIVCRNIWIVYPIPLLFPHSLSHHLPNCISPMKYQPFAFHNIEFVCYQFIIWTQ